jgi:hypothetical protein
MQRNCGLDHAFTAQAHRQSAKHLRLVQLGLVALHLLLECRTPACEERSIFPWLAQATDLAHKRGIVLGVLALRIIEEAIEPQPGVRRSGG